MIVHSRQQSGSVIRVKPLETMKVTSRIVKSPIITSDNVKKQILVTNGTGQSPNNGRIIQVVALTHFLKFIYLYLIKRTFSKSDIFKINNPIKSRNLQLLLFILV